MDSPQSAHTPEGPPFDSQTNGNVMAGLCRDRGKKLSLSDREPTPGDGWDFQVSKGRAGRRSKQGRVGIICAGQSGGN